MIFCLEKIYRDLDRKRSHSCLTCPYNLAFSPLTQEAMRNCNHPDPEFVRCSRDPAERDDQRYFRRNVPLPTIGATDSQLRSALAD